jgi:hypothetical protein
LRDVTNALIGCSLEYIQAFCRAEFVVETNHFKLDASCCCPRVPSSQIKDRSKQF